jgi:predicted nucleic acid-binding protein
VKPFLDTNILVYASLSDDPRRFAAERVLVGGGVVSAQVLNEFANVARGKLKWPWADIEATISLMKIRIRRVVPLTADTNAAALSLARDHSFAFYDALIVASAIEAGCDTLYSEDMQHGRVIGGLTIINPFLDSAP